MIEKTLTAIPDDKYKNVRPDWAFFIYFSIMFLFYMNTVIQLAIQLFILAYVVIRKIFPSGIVRLKKDTIKNIIFFVVWFGGLTLLFFLSSRLWAYDYDSDSHTMLDLFRCFGIGLAMFLYIDSTEKVLSILQSFAYASVIMGVAALVTTSPSQYFQSGDDGFGQVIGQQRNGVGAVGAGMTVICIYLKRYTDFKYGYYMSAFFVVLTVLTGSRGAIIQLLILFVLIVIIDKNLFKMLTKVIIFVLVSTVVLLIIRNVPALYENIWLRFGDLFSTITGEEIEDASTQGREFYKEIAWIMFKQRPLTGYGLDGFKLYLLNNPIYKGYYIDATYSHCNFSELMADLGIMGLLIWYVPTFYILIRGFIYRNCHPLSKIMFFWLLSMIILDYARIPWSTHPSSYQYFLVFLAIILMSNEAKYIKRKNDKSTTQIIEKD